MENREYIVDRDIIDSMRLEASIFKPTQHENLRNAVIRTVDSIASKYGEYIPEKTLTGIEGIEDRIIVLDNDSFSTLYCHWRKPSVDDPPTIDAHGVYIDFGRIIGLNDPDAWWERYPKELKEKDIERFGSEEKARAQLGWKGTVDTTVHEVVHQFQDSTLPREFLETATRFYQREAEEYLKLPYIVIDRDEEALEIYKELLSSYSEDMHKLFFGTLGSSERVEEILSHPLNADIVRLHNGA